MSIRPSLALFCLMASTALTLAPGYALAPAATPEGAQKLVETLQKYFGRPAAGEASSLTVTPAGNEYKVSIDPAKLMKPLAGLGMSVEMKPYELTMADQGDGTWRIVTGNYTDFTLKSASGIEQQVKVTNNKGEGIFDSALGVFRTGGYSVDKVTMVSTGKGLMQTASYGPVKYTMTGVANGKNAADVSAVGTLGNYTIDMNMGDPAAKSPAPVKIAVKMNDTSFDAKFVELHALDLQDLWAFLVAHPNKAAMAEAQADLKAALRKAMPMFRNLVENVTVKDVSVETPGGNFSGKDLGFLLDASGAVANAHYKFGLKGSSLAFPTATLPAWSKGMVPTLINLAPEISGMDFAAAGKEAIEDFTLNGDKPFSEADSMKILQALLPKGTAKVSLAGTHIVSSLLDITADGEMDVGMAQQSGKLNVSAKGIDAALDALKTAMNTDKSAAQAFGALSLAKGLGKPGANGAMVWALEMTPDHKFTVNGAPFGK